jgi:hypothetical protein
MRLPFPSLDFEALHQYNYLVKTSIRTGGN